MKVGEYQTTMFGLETKEEKCVRRISYEEAKPFLLTIHYARRMPCITHAFGLFVNGDLVGVATYGVPASYHLCIGIAGKEYKDNVLELNRLVLLPEASGKNLASYLVGNSLKQLPPRTFVVSYADTAWSHVGYVYQATNWLYTGMSAKRTDTYQPSGLHPRAYDKNNHSTLRQTRSQKHRYIYLVGNKKDKREMRKLLKYPVYDKYPKGDETHYDINNPKPINPMKIIDPKSKQKGEPNEEKPTEVIHSKI
jgi:GNAT superfamily N-acetyltransferase